MYHFNATGFTMGKAEEWGNPITEEALVRQGNEKCFQYRRKKSEAGGSLHHPIGLFGVAMSPRSASHRP